MQTNLLIVDHQETIPSKKPGHSKGLGKELGKGLIEEGQEQGREKTDFSSTLAEVANEHQSHPGSAGESRVERKKSENGETESEDLKKKANVGLAKAGKTSGPFLVLDIKADAGSGNERVVRGEALPGSGKGSPAKLKGIDKGTQGLDQANHKTFMGPGKANALKVDLPGLGLERKQGESEVMKVAATPRGLEKTEGLLSQLGAKPETKGQVVSETAATPRGLEKTEGLLSQLGAKPETKGQVVSETAATPRGLEKAEDLLSQLGAKPETKGQVVSETAATPRGLEKAEGLLSQLGAKPETKGQVVSETAATPRGLEKAEGLLSQLGAKPETKGQVVSETAATPRGLEKAEGLLSQLGAKPETKGQVVSETAATPRGLEKAEGLLRQLGAKPEMKGKKTAGATVNLRGLGKPDNSLKEFGEESGRIKREVQDKEPAAQKFRLGSMKGSTEESVKKEQGTEASIQRIGIDPKDARSETVKAKISEGVLTHKKVEKTESNSGENSNLSSRNFSTPDKGTGAISHSKEPQAFTKSAQADTLRQIVNKAAFNLENGRSEFKIDLKPESLGHLRMQILTENHHVTVRILAENPLVKDMIESNLGQLKANFQNQGLEIEKFDVSVAQDSDKNGTGDGRYDSKRMGKKSGDTGNGYAEKTEKPEEIDVSTRRGQQEGAVDFFA